VTLVSGKIYLSFVLLRGSLSVVLVRMKSIDRVGTGSLVVNKELPFVSSGLESIYLSISRNENTTNE
jgi:hypothetical protein